MSSRELQKTKILIANPPCPLFLKLQNSNIGKSIRLEFTESTFNTTRYHLIFAVRECFQQMHRGDHFNFERPSDASSWNDLCIRKPIAQPSESGVHLFLARSMSGIPPRGPVGVAWQAMKDAKTGGRDETASRNRKPTVLARLCSLLSTWTSPRTAVNLRKRRSPEDWADMSTRLRAKLQGRSVQHLQDGGGH